MTAFGLEATVTFTQGDDFYVFATIGDDVIAGLGGDDILIGGTGTDFIDGGTGTDMAVMQVSLANANLTLDAEGRLVVSSGVGGLLSFQHTLVNVERVQFLVLNEYDIDDLIGMAGGGTPTGQTFIGSNGADQMFGTSGDDLFRPRFGPDLVRGGPGQDTLELAGTLAQTAIFETTPTELAFRGNVGTRSFVYNVQDVETFVFSDGATYTFAEMVEIANNNTGEPLPDPTPGRDRLEGTAGADQLKGLGGADVLIGLGGADTLLGGAGADKLLGGAGADRLLGGAGADRLIGGAGGDRLIGGKGADVLTGGKGADVLTGNAGADVFAFDDRDTGLKPKQRDVITDFGGADVLDLRKMDADRGANGDQAFEFSGKKAAAHSIWYAVEAGDATLRGDFNGDGKADFAITLLDVTKLVADDFLL